MYKLTIRAHAKSRARLFGRRLKVKYFLVGQEYDIYYKIKNIGDEKSPSVKCYINITWPGTKASTSSEFRVKSLEPGKCDVSETKTYFALSTGLATITAYTIELKDVLYRKDCKSTLPSTEAFDTIFATTPEAIYEYWGLWVAAIGLIIIAFEKIWNTLRYFLPLPC
mgnify:CR=1 FL=1